MLKTGFNGFNLNIIKAPTEKYKNKIKLNCSKKHKVSSLDVRQINTLTHFANIFPNILVLQYGDNQKSR